MPTGSPFRHSLGDQIQLIKGLPKVTVVERRAGHFGAVYALEVADGSRVAVKTPRADLAVDSRTLEMFARETAIWSHLPTHPAILRLYRVLTYAGEPYAYMDYIPPVNSFGSSVASVLANVPGGYSLNLALPLTVLNCLTWGLERIEEHDPTLVHGDIKPQNLLVKMKPGSSGDPAANNAPVTDMTVVLSDFGLARAVAGGSHHWLGDRNYLAPEMKGSPSFWDEKAVSSAKAADAYSIGCTIFELLSGTSYQRLDQITGRPYWPFGNEPTPAALSDMRPDLPAPLAHFLARCLALEPERRPCTYREIRSAFQSAVRAAGGRSYVHEETVVKFPPGFTSVQDSDLGLYLAERFGVPRTDASAWLMKLFEVSSLRSVGRTSDALAALDDLEQVFPGVATVDSLRGQILMGKGEIHAAKQVFRRAVSSYQHDSKLAKVDQDGFEAACVNFTQMLSSPNSPPFEADAAVPLGRAAVYLAPDESTTHYSLGLALMRVGRVPEARQVFGQAAELDPANERQAIGATACELLYLRFWSTAPKPEKEPPAKISVSKDVFLRARQLADDTAQVLDREDRLPPGR